MLQVTLNPFTLAGPGQTATGTLGFSSPADASYTAAITVDPHSIFSVVKILALRPTIEYDDGGSGDGAPHHKPVKVIVDEPVGSSNGTTPLKVLKGDKLVVTAQMVCPNNPDDTYFATVTIVSSNSADTTPVQLSVSTGQVNVKVGSATVSAAPGTNATWLLEVQSVAGAGANISFAPELSGFPGGTAPPRSVTIPPVTWFLPRRGWQILAIEASVGETTPPGTYNFFVAETLFNDTFSPFYLSLTVTDPLISLTTSQPNAFEMVAGDTLTFSLDLKLLGAATTLDMTIDPTPPELTCTFIDSQGNATPKWHLDLYTKEEMHFTVRVMLASNFQGSVSSFSISWSAYGGTEAGVLNFGITALPQAVIFSSGILGPSTTTASGHWILNAQGFWNFQGHIEESGLIGHEYAFGMSLGVKDSNGNAVAVVHSGSVAGNTPFGGNEDDWNDKGFAQRIIDLWPAIVHASWAAKIDVTTDASDIFVAILELLGAAVAAVLLVTGYVDQSGKQAQCDDPNMPGDDFTGQSTGDWHCHP